MSLNLTPQPICEQLSQAIREMRNFLLDNPTDGDYYNMLYVKIDKLSIRTKTEGWFDYEHRNPHETLTDFLNSGDVHELVIKYYSIPPLGRKLIKQTKAEKIISGGKQFVEWITNQVSKFKPDVRLK